MPVTFTFGEFLGARSVIGTTLAELGDEYENLWVLTPVIGATNIVTVDAATRNSPTSAGAARSPSSKTVRCA